jgi:branched-chain amino acid transport system permease protein
MTVSRRAVVISAAVFAATLLPLLSSEASVYKLGLVAVLFVGAIGLHVLVNWAGELSLAHAALVGLPAFAVAKLSGDHGWSPILLLPLALLIGAVAGVVIGLPAIRARGLQVALVTLAAGVAIDRFFFTKDWLIGGGAGAQVSVPTLGPFTFASARALYPLLVLFVVGAVMAAWALHRSKVGRAWLWVKAQPDAAAAFGVPVARYRLGAYAVAGAYAGFSGGLTAMWVQHLTPAAFPPSRSFTYLIAVALAGPGFLSGLAAAVAVLEGGRLFLPNADALLAYGAPVGLIMTLTRYRNGLNGAIAALAGAVTSRREPVMDDAPVVPTLRVVPIVGAVAIALGFVGIGTAWYHAGNTSQLWIQNQELLSGGLGGIALVMVGCAVLVVDQLARLIRALELARAQAAVEPAPEVVVRPARTRKRAAAA